MGEVRERRRGVGEQGVVPAGVELAHLGEEKISRTNINQKHQ